MNMETISHILATEPNENDLKAIYYGLSSQELSRELAVFILEQTGNTKAHQLLHAFALNHFGEYDLAIGELDALIKSGVVYAMNLRAHMCLRGQGVEGNHPDFARAISLVEDAIALKDPDAMFLRACMLIDGLGSPANKFVDEQLLQKTITKGHIQAMAALAV